MNRPSAALHETVRSIIGDATKVLSEPDRAGYLTDLCATLRLVLGAAACSVARLSDDGATLVYEAAAGAGADRIIGVELSVTRGLAGYAARTGQAMVIDELDGDHRFARDVAESTGYVPTSLLVAPVVDDAGSVIGVVSVLDRSPAGFEPLACATSFAKLCAPLLMELRTVRALSPVLLSALTEALRHATTDPDDADSPEGGAPRAGDTSDAIDDPAARAVALVIALRSASPHVAAAAERIVGELLALDRRSRQIRQATSARWPRD